MPGQPMRRTEPPLLVTALLLSGCSLAPDYHRPVVGTPAAYQEAPDGWTVAAPAAATPGVVTVVEAAAVVGATMG